MHDCNYDLWFSKIKDSQLEPWVVRKSRFLN